MQVTIDDPVKSGDGLSSSLIYKVNVECDDGKATSANRSYSDFQWLHARFIDEYPGYIIPPLPEKTTEFALGLGFGGDKEFLSHRKKGLQRFLEAAITHPAIGKSTHLSTFVEAADDAFARHRAATKSDPVNDLKLAAGRWWDKKLQQFTENESIRSLAAAAGKEMPTRSSTEHEFDGIVKYTARLLHKAQELHSSTKEAFKASKALGQSLRIVASATESIKDAERGQPLLNVHPLSAAVVMLKAKAHVSEQQMRNICFDVGDFVQQVLAVKQALEVRENKRLAYEQADYDLTSRKSSGSLETAARSKLYKSKEDFEKVHARVVEEFNLFQAQKAAALPLLFQSFIGLQLTLHKAQAVDYERAHRICNDAESSDMSAASDSEEEDDELGSSLFGIPDDVSAAVGKNDPKDSLDLSSLKEAVSSPPQDSDSGNAEADKYMEVSL